MSSKLITPPAVEPITLQEAKDFLRVDLTEDDDLITSLITSARQRVETELRRALATQTWRMKADGFPRYEGNNAWRFNGRRYLNRNAIVLPFPPVQSVTSITYLDAARSSQTLDPATYTVSTDSEPAEVTLATINTCWPITSCILKDSVTVTFVAGYGTADDVPEGIKTAIKMFVSHWYTNRAPVVTGTIATEIPMTIKALLDPFRWGSYV